MRYYILVFAFFVFSYEIIYEICTFSDIKCSNSVPISLEITLETSQDIHRTVSLEIFTKHLKVLKILASSEILKDLNIIPKQYSLKSGD